MRRRSVCALGFFLSFFLLFSSGRVASLDAAQQLQVAVMLAATGEMGSTGAPGGPPTDGWVRAPNGRMYQAHDIGNVILMLPAAVCGSYLSPVDARDQIAAVPAATRAAASLTCAIIAAVGCWWFFRLCALCFPVRTAFALSIAFPVTTLLWAYARAAWDVLGACVFLVGVLYYSACVLRGLAADRHALLAAVTLAAAISFRYSLAPFIVPAALFVAIRARRSVSSRTWWLSASAFFTCMLPTLAYNYLRTGSMLRPATTAPQYLDSSASLAGSVPHGLYGLFISPNRGLFVFCPVLLLVLALPWVWRRVDSASRALLTAYGGGAMAYLLLIAKMQYWHGNFGWGPRFVVPVLPVFAFAAAVAAVLLWRKARAVVLLLALASFLLALPSGVVNWHLATTHFTGALDHHATRPLQLQAAWRTFLMGLRGRDLPAPADAIGDPARATTGEFPDLLIVRVFRHFPAGRLPAVAAGILLLVAGGLCGRHVLAAGGGVPGGHAIEVLTTR